MLRPFARALTAALLFVTTAAAVSAATVMDASTFSCKELTEKDQSQEKDSVYGASVILYWMAGYHQTDDQGTVVDFDNMLKEFNQTTAFCKENPGIGVLTATEKIMGENSAKATTKALDLSIIKCEHVNSTKESEMDGLGQILMWLSGYHTSLGESTMIDMEKFGKNVEQMAAFCAENPEVGLFTASEKFMGEGDDDSSEDAKE